MESPSERRELEESTRKELSSNTNTRMVGESVLSNIALGDTDELVSFNSR